MNHMIEHVCEPDRLILTWQARDLDGERKRFGVGDLIRDGENAILEYRSDADVDQARTLGYEGYPAFKLGVNRHVGALPTFMRRLPPRERSDFSRYLALFCLSADTMISDFSLLGYTEAKLPSDGFALVSSLSQSCVPSEHLMELAGFRHYPEAVSQLQVGDELIVEPEPNNRVDSNAIVVKRGDLIVGYVNRFQASTFHEWLESDRVQAWVERRNGSPERPRAYMFVRVS